MRIKFGIKALSILSSMVLSLVVIGGCNEEPAPSTSPTVTPAGKPDAKTGTPPAPSVPSSESKKTP